MEIYTPHDNSTLSIENILYLQEYCNIKQDWNSSEMMNLASMVAISEWIIRRLYTPRTFKQYLI